MLLHSAGQIGTHLVTRVPRADGFSKLPELPDTTTDFHDTNDAKGPSGGLAGFDDHATPMSEKDAIPLDTSAAPATRPASREATDGPAQPIRTTTEAPHFTGTPHAATAEPADRLTAALHHDPTEPTGPAPHTETPVKRPPDGRIGEGRRLGALKETDPEKFDTAVATARENVDKLQRVNDIADPIVDETHQFSTLTIDRDSPIRQQNTESRADVKALVADYYRAHEVEDRIKLVGDTLIDPQAHREASTYSYGLAVGLRTDPRMPRGGAHDHGSTSSDNPHAGPSTGPIQPVDTPGPASQQEEPTRHAQGLPGRPSAARKSLFSRRPAPTDDDLVRKSDDLLRKAVEDADALADHWLKHGRHQNGIAEAVRRRQPARTHLVYELEHTAAVLTEIRKWRVAWPGRSDEFLPAMERQLKLVYRLILAHRPNLDEPESVAVAKAAARRFGDLLGDHGQDGGTDIWQAWMQLSQHDLGSEGRRMSSAEEIDDSLGNWQYNSRNKPADLSSNLSDLHGVLQAIRPLVRGQEATPESIDTLRQYIGRQIDHIHRINDAATVVKNRVSEVLSEGIEQNPLDPAMFADLPRTDRSIIAQLSREGLKRELRRILEHEPVAAAWGSRARDPSMRWSGTIQRVEKAAAKWFILGDLNTRSPVEHLDHILTAIGTWRNAKLPSSETKYWAPSVDRLEQYALHMRPLVDRAHNIALGKVETRQTGPAPSAAAPSAAADPQRAQVVRFADHPAPAAAQPGQPAAAGAPPRAADSERRTLRQFRDWLMLKRGEVEWDSKFALWDRRSDELKAIDGHVKDWKSNPVTTVAAAVAKLELVQGAITAWREDRRLPTEPGTSSQAPPSYRPSKRDSEMNALERYVDDALATLTAWAQALPPAAGGSAG